VLVWYVVAIVVVAFIFDFINGFHDSANSIATIVGTPVLSPLAAVIWAAFFNFIAAFTVGTAVARAVGQGLIDVSIVTPNVILGGLLGAIIWNLITWYYGIPSSSSHALIGGYAGSAVAKAGLGAITWGAKWVQTLSFILISPLVGLAAGFVLMVAVYWIFQKVSVTRVDRIFRPAQLLSSALLSWSHGGNDAQKTMGIIAVLLYSQGMLGPQFHVPFWVVITCQAAMALGTLFGGWRIVHTMGSKITRLSPMQGFCAETGGAITLFAATYLGIPVSTTHTITGAIIGVGAARRVSAVRWNVASSIVTAWIVTIPASALIAAISYYLTRLFA